MNCIDLMSETSNNAKLQKWSNYEEVHGFDVKTIKNVELRPKPFQTQQNYKSDQITRKCMDLTSKRTKMLSYVPNHSKQRKSTTFIKVQWIASIWCQKHQTTQNYKSDQSTMNCIDLTLKRSKMFSYVPNHSKQFKPKYSNYDELHGFDVKTIKNVELRPKPFKTTQTYKSNQITMNCIDLMSETSNNAKLQKWSNYEEVHGFDVKTNKNVELRPKPFKTTQIYKIYQSTMNCIDLMSKTSNNAKLQKWSNYDELHRFDVKTIKNVV